jgi:hypothetical protein
MRACLPVMHRRAPQRTVEYACGILGRAPCIHVCLPGPATKPGELSGLALKAYQDRLRGQPNAEDFVHFFLNQFHQIQDLL